MDTNVSPVSVVSKQKISKLLLKVTLFLCALFIVVFLVILLRRGVQNKKMTQPHLSYLDISTKTLSWITKQQRDNIYPLGYFCTFDKICSPFIHDYKSGISVIWGRYQYYSFTRQKNQLSILNQDLSAYLDKSRIPTVQIDFWDCKLMYNLWKSNILSDDLKQKAKIICTRGQYDVKTFDVFTKFYKDPVEPDPDQIINGKQYPNLLPSDKTLFDEYAAYSAESASMYSWFKRKNDLLEAKSNFIDALITYDLKNNQQNHSSLGIASADLYYATYEDKYLRFAKYILNTNSHCHTLMECISRTILAKEIFTITKDGSYDKISKSEINNIISHYFDAIGYNGNFMNTKSFRISTLDKYFYPITENALMVGLLLQK